MDSAASSIHRPWAKRPGPGIAPNIPDLDTSSVCHGAHRVDQVDAPNPNRFHNSAASDRVARDSIPHWFLWIEQALVKGIPLNRTAKTHVHSHRM